MNDNVQRRGADVIGAVRRDRSMRFADRASRLVRHADVATTTNALRLLELVGLD